MRVYMFVNIVFPIPNNQEFTYSIPSEFVGMTKPGCRALVPFGNRILTGFIVGNRKLPDDKFKVKPIIDVLDSEPVISASMLEMARWMADYYMCSLGEAIRVFLPSGMLLQSKKYAELNNAMSAKTSSIAQRKIINTIETHKSIQLERLKRIVGKQGFYYNLTKLVENGSIVLKDKMVGRKNYERTIKFVKLIAAPATDEVNKLISRSPRQIAMLDELKKSGGVEQLSRLCKSTNSSSQTAKALEKKRLIKLFDRVVEQDYYGDLHVPPAPRLVLNSEQEQAVTKISEPLLATKKSTFLLLGVTGSGKTQVYIEVMRQALQQKKGAIVLVPEIALTPQTVYRFRSEFQNEVTVMHSRMSPGERYGAWSRIRQGKCKVVVGPRSAIFAPVINLGLIVVDEEHDGSYKQSENVPRYNARDLAVIRGNAANAVVVLGSATPALETYHNAKTGKYSLVELKKRIADIPLPKVAIVDLARERLAGQRQSEVIISRKLVQKIAEKLQRKEQIILLQNRRGFSTTVQCAKCGEVTMCPNCNISLSFHRQGNIMRCHYCNFAQKLQEICEGCKNKTVLHRGVGTQQVQEFLQSQFPDARIARMDMDTTRQKHAHDKILTSFRNHKYDILLGTQMIAKGLDFEKVTLVGVISADTGLFLPDFRATERTFQLLTQVAGRAGRKNGQGEVIIQTMTPQHPSVQFARTHDYFTFAETEIRERKALEYPPIGRLALLHFSHKDEKLALQAARKFAFLLEGKNEKFKIVGPAPAALSRLKELYRFHLLIKSDKFTDPGAQKARENIQICLNEFDDGTDVSRVQIKIDIDPVLIL
ncbi:MAG: primosomal protein N' [Calditrichaeota bacterium]|nr:MAG: primosomal protein N' [Calditrichota bacterium]